MNRIIILVALGFYAVAAEARVGMERQYRYENDAFLAGACGYTEHLKYLEAVYNACGASDGQWDSMYGMFKEGEKKPESCGDGVRLLEQGRVLETNFGESYSCQ